MTDQPGAAEALRTLEPLVGEWRMTAASRPRRRAVAGREGGTSFAWHESGAHLVQRTTVQDPGVPDSVSIIGADAANGTFFQLYSDVRGVSRIYELTIADGERKLWRTRKPFPQRFSARFDADGSRIVGRWEKADAGTRLHRRLHRHLHPGLARQRLSMPVHDDDSGSSSDGFLRPVTSS